MSREELIEKSNEFSLPDEELALRHKEADEFRQKFPMQRLVDLTPNEFCGLGNNESFVYWLERRIGGFTITSGPNSKFGVYQSGKDKNFYIGIRGRKRLLVGAELDRELHELMRNLTTAFSMVFQDKVEEIAALNIPIGQMVLIKILSLYFPEKFLKIAQRDVLMACGRDLGLDESQIKTENLIFLNWLCRKVLGEISSFHDQDNEWYAAYVWKTYQHAKPNPGTNTPPIVAIASGSERTLNMILYGPPGTGKTYNSIDKAVEIVDNNSSRIHAENKARFDELRQQGQIEFVTFHQNYAYEDFVVGLRPDVEVETLRFQTHKGIFYQMAKRARDNYDAFVSGMGKRRSFDEVFQELVEPLEKSEEVEIKMVSGISFWITEVSDKSISFRKQSGGTQHTLSISTLRDLVDEIGDIPTGLASYYIPLAERIRQRRQTTESAEPIKDFVLIIDEINRANISKVFGELITLLEEDKRLGGENELKVTLPNGEKDFGVPPNLYLIGTMNTADKSIALIDIALRRRFDFIGYYPEYNRLSEGAAELLRTINSRIFEKKKSADYLIGHAYFMGGGSVASVLRNKVIPLLTEYFAGKTDIITDVFAGTAWSVAYNTDSFAWDISEL